MEWDDECIVTDGITVIHLHIVCFFDDHDKRIHQQDGN